MFNSDHIAELKNMKPKQPFFFLKPPSSILLNDDGPCLQPQGVKMHFEVELALIIGKVVRDLKADDRQGALDAIKGELLSPIQTAEKHLHLPHTPACPKQRLLPLRSKP